MSVSLLICIQRLRNNRTLLVGIHRILLYYYFACLLACLQKNRLLDEIDLEMDSTSEKLKRTIAKVDTVLAISKGKVAS